jgi:hypothetical protein
MPSLSQPRQTKPPQVDPLEELRARLEKAEKIAADNKAWGTKQAQELAAIKREREQQQREASKPQILDANPELADAIRYVANDPAPQQQQEQRANQWQEMVATAHPGIFDVALTLNWKQRYSPSVIRWVNRGMTRWLPSERLRQKKSPTQSVLLASGSPSSPRSRRKNPR